MQEELDLSPLIEFLQLIPGVEKQIASSIDDEERWAVTFKIDIDHALAWRVIQELANVVNYLSSEERLPTIFYPISTSPYLHGGPQNTLSWVIQCGDPLFLPGDLLEWLEARLPDPVDDEYEWDIEDEEE